METQSTLVKIIVKQKKIFERLYYLILKLYEAIVSS